MKTYAQVREVIRDICTPCSIPEIKWANKNVKAALPNEYLYCNKYEDEFTTMMRYSFKCSDRDDIQHIDFDFWGHQVMN